MREILGGLVGGEVIAEEIHRGKSTGDRGYSFDEEKILLSLIRAGAVKLALNDFINNIYLLGYGSSNRVVRQTLEYIARHYSERVSLEEIASETGLSVSRLAHLVKEHTGRTILQHVHQLRIREAQRLLQETSLGCADIACEVGFLDQSYFAKCFCRHTGLTPMGYRTLRR